MGQPFRKGEKAPSLLFDKSTKKAAALTMLSRRSHDHEAQHLLLSVPHSVYASGYLIEAAPSKSLTARSFPP